MENKPLRPNGFKAICEIFGNIDNYFEDGIFQEERWIADKMIIIHLPFSLPYSDNRALMLSKLKVNKIISPVFEALFKDMLLHGYESLLTDCGGAYCYRNKRGNERSYSSHSWGIAVDLNVKENQMGTYGDMPVEIIRLFKDYGFIWGGEWPMPSTDPMHFQYCQGY